MSVQNIIARRVVNLFNPDNLGDKVSILNNSHVRKALNGAVKKISNVHLQNLDDIKRDAAKKTYDAEPAYLYNRPEGDNRDSEEILSDSDAASTLFENCPDQVVTKLERMFGDGTEGCLDRNPDAMYRATKFVESFDDDDDGTIDGYTGDNEARNGTEAGRLQDATRGKDYVAVQPQKEVTAGDIINANPVLKNLPKDGPIRQELKDRVGDFEKDPDAAAKAVAILNYIDTSKDAAGIDRNVNGVIDGFDDSGMGAHGTEAGLLRDYLKSGGELKEAHRLDAPAESDGNPKYAPDYAHNRPPSDTRKSEQILSESPLMTDLLKFNYDQIQQKLEVMFGDGTKGCLDKDPDAMYRATKYVESFDIDRDGYINGYTTKDGEAKNGTEAGHLQDGTRGKGHVAAVEPSEDDISHQMIEDIRLDALKNNDETKPAYFYNRPDDDHRDSEEILSDSEAASTLFASSPDQVVTKLEKMFGDGTEGCLDRDPDAMYRATKFVESFDGDSDGTINGYTDDNEAKNGTEAGYLQDATRGKDYIAAKPRDAVTADDIINANLVLKNLPKDGSIRQELKNKLGADFETDADAAARAVILLNEINTAKDADGIDREANDSIDGFDDNGMGAHGTEAGLLRDYLKPGGEIKGDLRLDAPTEADGRPKYAPDYTHNRPLGDTRTSKQILRESPLMTELLSDNHDQVRQKLEVMFGDGTNGCLDRDSDAMYRATEYAESFDTDGDGYINGYTGDGEAESGTEAGRLQDGTRGKSYVASIEPIKIDPLLDGTGKPYVFSLTKDQTRPPGDYRSAKEIIDGDPTLKNLSQEARDSLKAQLPDYETNADQAYRASQVLVHIQKYDEDGGVRGYEKKGDFILSKPNSVIDGYFKEDGILKASAGTESGLLQDFGKYGYSVLKGNVPLDEQPRTKVFSLPVMGEKRPPGDARSAEDIIKANPTLANLSSEDKEKLKFKVGDFEHDADAAYRASDVIDYITHVDEKGQSIKLPNAGDGGNTPGNTSIDGYWLSSSEVSKTSEGSEASRLEGFFNDGYASLKGIDSWSEDEKIEELTHVASMNCIKVANGKAVDLGDAYYNDGAVSDVRPADKAATLIALQTSLAEYKAGIAAYSDRPDHIEDSQEVIDFEANVQKRIDKLSADPEVQEFFAEHVRIEIKKMVDADPALKAEIQRRSDAVTSPDALKIAFDQKGSDGKPVGTTEALGTFTQKAKFYESALGADLNLVDIIANAPQEIKDKITKEYEYISSGAEIQDLMKKGSSYEDALLISTGSMAIYDDVMAPEAAQAGAAKFRSAAMGISTEGMGTDVTVEKMWAGLGVTGADDPKLRTIIEDNMDVLFEGVPMSERPLVEDIMKGLATAAGALLGGSGLPVALESIFPGNVGPVGETFKAGVMHGVAAVLSGAFMLAQAGLGKIDPSDFKTVVSSFMTVAVATEAGGMYMQNVMGKPLNYSHPDPARLRAEYYEKVGKAVANISKFVGVTIGCSVFMVVNSLAAAKFGAEGNTIEQGFSGTFAALNGLLATSVGVDVGVYLRGLNVAPGGSLALNLGRLSALAGVVSLGNIVIIAVVSFIYMVVSSFINGEKDNKIKNDWQHKMEGGFAELGLKDMPGWVDNGYT